LTEPGLIPTKGRPRPQATLDRDERVYQILEQAPDGLSRDEVATQTEISPSAAYLSLFRLQRDGRIVKISSGSGTGRKWKIATAQPPSSGAE